MTPALLAGFSLGLSLILAIGAQNAFVLRQGLRGEHVLPIVLTCALSDAVLITLGVGFFGVVSTIAPDILPALRWGGALFLLAYAARSLWAAATATEDALQPAAETRAGLSKVLMTCLALTWLNPHVYLDTVVLLGGLSTQYADRTAFGLGAASASLAFFLALGYGARLLRPLFAKPAAWRVLDGIVAVVMATIGVGLVVGG